MSTPRPTPRLTAFGLGFYRSFGQEGFLVRTNARVNVFAGKNNSGKSNILRGIRILSRLRNGVLEGRDVDFLDWHRRVDTEPVGIARLSIQDLFPPQLRGMNPRIKEVNQLLESEVEIRWGLRSRSIILNKTIASMSRSLLSTFQQAISDTRWNGAPSDDQYRNDIHATLWGHAIEGIRRILQKTMTIPVFREIRNETNLDNIAERFDGHGIIPQLRKMRSPRLGQENDREIFNRIERFTQTLIGDNTLALDIPAEEDRLVVRMNGLRLPLENYGTGIHHLVILCSVLAMHEDHAMLIEEPEVHLHPDLQRKLLRFIIAETRNTYFVSTHSNVFLDAAKDVDVYHVKYDHLASRVVPSIAAGASRELLEDMGYKASDLLQVNGIIWVEGPSDRTYINKWISLTNPELIEGIHYAVMFFGGGTVSHISGDQDKIDNLVNLKKINPNAFVVLDSDRASDDDQLSEDARRLQNEFNAACWITAGKTIENYLPVDLVRSCFSEDIENDVKFTIGQYDDVIKTLNSIPGRRKSTRKTICAKLFCSRMSSGDLDILDLRFSIQKIVNHIMHWNLTDVPSADS